MRTGLYWNALRNSHNNPIAVQQSPLDRTPHRHCFLLPDVFIQHAERRVSHADIPDRKEARLAGTRRNADSDDPSHEKVGLAILPWRIPAHAVLICAETRPGDCSGKQPGQTTWNLV